MTVALKIFDESDPQPEWPAPVVNSSLAETPIPGSTHTLVFDADAHSYTHAGRKMKGVSSLIKEFTPKFDAGFWSQYKADKAGLTQQQILDEWAAKRDAACDLGHAVHEIAELIALTTWEIGHAGELVGYENGILNAYRDLQIEPIEPEKPVCDPAIGIAGTVDLICSVFDVPTILDWKTNKTIDMHNSYGDTMLPPLSHLDCCNFNHYSLQLNLYRFILARRYDFHAERMVLVWLPGDSTYQLIEVPIMGAEVALMISAWQRSRS